MLQLIIRFWPYIVTVMVIAGLLVLINYWRVEAGKIDGLEKQISELNLEIAVERKRVIDNKSITEKVETNYETRLNNLNKLLDSLQSRPARCITPTKAYSPISTATGEKLPGGNAGITEYALYDFAGRCEKTRVKLLGTQELLGKIYAN